MAKLDDLGGVVQVALQVGRIDDDDDQSGGGIRAGGSGGHSREISRRADCGLRL